MSKKLISITLVAYAFFASQIFSNEVREPKHLSTEEIFPHLTTAKNTIIWCGSGFPNATDFDKILNTGDTTIFLKKGLAYLKLKQDSSSCSVLAEYYQDIEEYSEAFRWASEGSKRGCGFCMSVLRWSYANGKGITNNSTESTKWLYIAASKGREEEKKLLESLVKYSVKHPENKTLQDDLEKGKLLAKDWMKKNPQAFIISNEK